MLPAWPGCRQSLLPADGGFYAAAVDCSKTTDGNGRKCTPGCFLGDSRGQGMLRRPLRQAAMVRRSSSETPGAGRRSVTRGLPSVMVPVLSSTTVSIWCRVSSAEADLTRIPFSAPLSGANHDGHRCGQPQRTGAGDHQYRNGGGQSKAKGCPQSSQTRNVTRAIAMTAGTKMPAILSARRAIGALVAEASSTK